MVKCRLGALLRKTLDPRKATKTRLKLVAHDIQRVGYVEIIEGVAPHWPRKGAQANFVPRPVSSGHSQNSYISVFTLISQGWGGI